MELTRRELVGTGSLVTLAALAGCLDDGGTPASGNGNGNGNGDGNGDDSGNGNDDDTGNGNGEDDAGDAESDAGHGDPDENADGDGDGSSETDTTPAGDDESFAFTTASVPETDATAAYTEDEAMDALPLEDETDGTRERAADFVAETDFDRSVVAVLRTRAPNGCYEFVLTEAGIDEDGVTVRAAATDDDAQGACTQAEEGMWLLVRLTADGEVPNEGTMSIIDADGKEYGFGYGRGSESAGGGAEAPSDGNSSDGGGSDENTTDGTDE